MGVGKGVLRWRGWGGEGEARVPGWGPLHGNGVHVDGARQGGTAGAQESQVGGGLGRGGAAGAASHLGAGEGAYPQRGRGGLAQGSGGSRHRHLGEAGDVVAEGGGAGGSKRHQALQEQVAQGTVTRPRRGAPWCEWAVVTPGR